MRLNILKVLADEEIEAIHEASLRILAETGLLIDNQEILNLLRKAGARVDLENRSAKIPQDLTEAALKTVPCEIILYNRNREPMATLGDGHSYSACGLNAIYFFNPDDSERRPATKEDASNLITIVDALERFTVVGPPAIPQDVPPQSCYLHAADAAFNNTTKHLYMAPETAPVARAILDMARVVAGTDDLSLSPIISYQVSIQSPLTWSEDLGDIVLTTVRAGIPICFHTAPLVGLSGPITLAGLLALYNAEVLSGVVISQLIKKGSLVIYGGGWGTFDLRQATRVLGSPEGALLRIAGGQITRFYSIPSHSMGPDSDSHCHDEQNGWEKMLTAICALASGLSLVVNSSMFGSGVTVSYEQLVLDHEILSIAYRLLEGIKVSPETIALDVIQKVCPHGNFLMEKHTLKYLRSGEHWDPQITNRYNFDQWQKRGGLNVVKRARDRAMEILESYQPQPLGISSRKELNQIIEVFEREELAVY